VTGVKIGGLYTAQIVRADESDSLGSAAERMHIDRVGSLAVFSEDRLIGIITESDLVRAMADGANSETSTVSDYMTARPITVGVDEDSKEVAQTMLALGIRHLPVAEHDRVVGIISIRDLAVLEAWEPGEVPD
jgi:CBS domain-containing protein